MKPIFDSDLTLARKLRALRSGEPADFLMRHVADDLAERLAPVERHFHRAVALFCLTPHAADAMTRSGTANHVLRVEADESMLSGEHEGVVAPAETVPFEPGSIELAVSLMTLHEVNDLPGLPVQIRRALRPAGLF